MRYPLLSGFAIFVGLMWIESMSKEKVLPPPLKEKRTPLQWLYSNELVPVGATVH